MHDSTKFLPGMLNNFYPNFPDQGGPLDDWKFVLHSVTKLAHIILGVVLLVLVIVTLVRAVHKRLLIGSSDNTTILCDAQTGEEIRTLSGHISALASVAFSPDGKTLATAALDGSAKTWNAATGQELFTEPGYYVEPSPDNRHLVTQDVFGVMRGFYLYSERPGFMA
jgi:hypothetical protein